MNIAPSKDPSPERDKKRLILRLSSLGDVILASAALETPAAHEGVDWVVAREFAPILRGHPRVRKLWEFDRKTGFSGWVRLCRELRNEGYDEIYDLHCTQRSALARVLFFLWSLSGDGGPRWKSFSKDRWRLYGYFTFKKLWPKGLRPKLFVERFAHALGGTGQERPDLRQLVDVAAGRPMEAELETLLRSGKPYLCVMPSSRWEAKQWPARHYAELLMRMEVFPVIFGTDRDAESRQLVEELRARGRPHASGVGKLDLPQAARLLAGATGYLGGDTGLAHLAEAVGVPVRMILGPTIGDLGFGPWRPESKAIGSSIACRPCSKDGRGCFRIQRRFACLRELSVEAVAADLGLGVPTS